MIRLTNYMRDAVCKDAVDFKMKDTFDELKTRENKLAEECYHKLFKNDIDSVLKVKDDRWFKYSTSLNFYLGFRCVELKFLDKHRVPWAMNTYPSGEDRRFMIADSLDINADFEKLIADKKEAATLKEQLTNKVRALLGSVTTMKRLKEIWPEGHVFYEKYIRPDDEPGLPAIQVSEINSILGLQNKTSQKEAA